MENPLLEQGASESITTRLDNCVLIASGAPAQLKFNYDLLSDDAARLAMAVADRIKLRLTGQYIATGHDLIEVKEKLGHGHFGAWLEAEFGMTARTAERYMAAARFDLANSDIMSDLLPETMKALASPTMPLALRNALVRHVREGNSLLPENIKAALRDYRDRASADRESAARLQREANRRAAALKRLAKEQAAAEQEEIKRRDRLSPIARRFADSVTKNDLSTMLQILTDYDDRNTFLGILSDIAEGVQ